MAQQWHSAPCSWTPLDPGVPGCTSEKLIKRWHKTSLELIKGRQKEDRTGTTSTHYSESLKIF